MSTPPAKDQLEETADLYSRTRDAHRQFPTGVTVVTAFADGKDPVGLAVNAFSSISMDPPLVLVCVNESSASYPAVFDSEYIGINILAANQTDVVKTFSKSGGDKFADLDWQRSRNDVPVLDGVAGHLELEVKYKIPAHSHTIFIGEVTEASATEENAPLVYKAGKFYDGNRLEPTL